MAGSRPKVTVLIPTHNRAHYLSEAIRSVLEQTFEDFELIVIDDGSTDDTAHVLHEIDDARLRCVRREHGGVSAAMNHGLRVARGDYAARLDSDDVWLPNFLQSVVAVLDARPEIDAVYGKAQAMDARGSVLSHTQGMAPRFPEDDLRSMLYDDFTCNIVTIARRSCIDRAGGYDESLKANEDWDLWLRVAQHARFAFVPRVLGRYRWHEGNMTGPSSALFATVLQTRTRPLDKLFSQPNLPAAVAAMKPTAYENVHLFCGLRWLRALELGRAWTEFRLAVAVSDAPLRAVMRILWFVLLSEGLNRFEQGRRFVRWLTALRHRWLRRRRAI